MTYSDILTPERLAKLAAELSALRDASQKGELDLQRAPVMTSWSIVDVSTPGLFGQVFGHPKLGTGNVLTSALLAIDVDAGWARTINTLYRLD